MLIIILWRDLRNADASNPDQMPYILKPRGIPLMELAEISISLDEFEAIRLADYEGLYHEDSAGKMEISRPTFGRILNDAHRKIAECLLQGTQRSKMNKKN